MRHGKIKLEGATKINTITGGHRKGASKAIPSLIEDKPLIIDSIDRAAMRSKYKVNKTYYKAGACIRYDKVANEIIASNDKNKFRAIMKATALSDARNSYLRFYTINEAERGQGLPTNYTRCLSRTRSFQVIGNGWQVDAIKTFFRNLS
jgi:ribosomal protein S26